MKHIKIFSLSSNPKLAQEISQKVGVKLSNVDVMRFSDGEVSINNIESVRGQDVFVIQPTSSPVNENLMEVLIMCDALKRASAATINLILPYYGYSRADRKAMPRQAITAKLVADLLQTAGATRVMCMDLHAAQIQGFFNIPIDNFPAGPLFAAYLLRKKLKNIVVVSPDHGGVTRARNFARHFNAPLAIIDKRRPKPNQAQIMNIIGDVKDAVCIMIDDIVDTAGTLCAGADALKNAGASAIYACATHGLLSGDAISKIENSALEQLIITNSVNLPPEKQTPKIKQLSVGALLGESIIHIVNDEPISQIFEKIEEMKVWN